MRNLWEKFRKSELAIGISVGLGALIVVVAIILIVVNILNGGSKPVGKEPAGSKIVIDYNFNKSELASANSSKSASIAGSSKMTASNNTSTANNSEVDRNPNSNNQYGNNSAYIYSQPKQPNDTSSAYKPVKPAGTLANVSETDRKGLAMRNKARAVYLADVYYNTFFNETYLVQFLSYPFKKEAQVATAWEYGALQSMQTVIAKADKTKKQLNRVVAVNKGLEYYGKMKDGKFWAYVVHRGDGELGATDNGLAYDDDMWIAINLVRSYELTGKKEYLERAKYLVKFIIKDAWFEPLGGIFWDTRHEARHSCSNNPMLKVLVDIYKHTGDKYYLNWAVKIYDFARKNLKDEKKNIYEDLIGARYENGVWVEGSSHNTGFYSYNTGTMISGAAALYGATGDKKYLSEALSCAEGAMNHFGDRGIMNGYTAFACTSNIWFNTILLRGYIDLYPYAKKEAAKYIVEFQKSMDFAYVINNADKMGVMPYDWIRGWDSLDRSTYRNALDMSANAEMYGMLATWQHTRND